MPGVRWLVLSAWLILKKEKKEINRNKKPHIVNCKKSTPKITIVLNITWGDMFEIYVMSRDLIMLFKLRKRSSNKGGFVKNVAAPSCLHRSMSSVRLEVLTTTTGIWLNFGFSFKRRKHSNPSILGMFKSRKIISYGGGSSTSSIASAPLFAIWQTMVGCISFKASQKSCWSSTSSSTSRILLAVCILWS